MKTAVKKALMIGVVIVAAVVLSSCGYNTMQRYEEAVFKAWGDLDAQLQRRADLIPNLVETVKGFAAQERETLEAVINARSRASSIQLTPEMLSDPQAVAQFQEAQGSLSSALSRLMVVVEAYPELKSNQNFRDLQVQLEGTENRIAVARRDYIEAVQLYNTELKTIPGRWWRSLMYPQNQPMQTFSVEEDKTKLPEVKF